MVALETINKLEWGIWQGCPLSAYLLILVNEVLANNICNDSQIKGIKIDNIEIKISLLADYITLILIDLISMRKAVSTCKLFQQCSGLKLNINKPKAQHTGNVIDPDHFPRGLSWIQSPVETLGVTIHWI